jgi:hypothetical protein
MKTRILVLAAAMAALLLECRADSFVDQLNATTNNNGNNLFYVEQITSGTATNDAKVSWNSYATYLSTLTNFTGVYLQRSNNLSDVTSTSTALGNLGGVPTSRTVNGHALTGNVVVTTNDFSAAPFANVAYSGSFSDLVGSLSLSSIASIANNTILGNNSGGSGAPLALTPTQAKTVLSLNNVENTALSTWAGSGNITTVGTITSGTWSGTAIATNKIGTLATVAYSGSASDLGVGTLPAARLPNPSASTLGGVQSITSASHQWVSYIDTSGVPHQSQPAFSDISGSVAASQLPNPSASTLGGVQSITAASHQFLTAISTAGVPSQAQPAFSDISGSVAAAQLPNPSASTLGGVQSIASASHQFLTAISTAGVPSQAQPAFTDISGTATKAQLPTGTYVSSAHAVADANYTAASTDTWIYYTSITAARTVTLPAASAVTAGSWVVVGDASGSANGTKTITIQKAGSDTVNGGTSIALSTAYGAATLYSDGTSKWSSNPAGGGSGTVTSVGLTMPSGFSVSSSPVTGAGTLGVTITGDVPWASHKITGLADPTAQTDAATFSVAQNYQLQIYNALGSAIKAQNMPIQLCQSALTTSSGYAFYCAEWLPTAQTITGVCTRVNTAANYTPSNFNGVALFTYSGGTLTQVAVSSGSGQQWTTTGLVKTPFTGTYSAAPGLYFAMMCYSESAHVTQPRFWVTSGTGTDNLDCSNSSAICLFKNGTTSAPSTISASTMSTPAAQGLNEPWMGLY